MPDRLGGPGDLHLGRELDLRRPEPAERAVGRRVGRHGTRPDPDVRDVVRATRMDRPAREDDRREGRVRAAVHDEVDVLRRDRPVAPDPRAIPDHRRVPLRRRGQVLVAVVDHPHRAARLAREQRGVEGDHRRVLLLAPEPAARLRLHDLGVCVVEVETGPERLVHVERALEAAVDGHAAVLARHRDDRVVLDVQLLLVADAVGRLDDLEPVLLERRVDVALDELVVGEDRRRFQRLEDGRQRRRSERDPLAGLAEGVAVRRRQQRHGLRLVPDLPADRDEDRLVLGDARDDVPARDVVRGDDRDPRPVEGRVELDREQAGVRHGRPDRRAVPGAGEDQVVGVERLPGELGRALAARREGDGDTHAPAPRTGLRGSGSSRGWGLRGVPGRVLFAGWACQAATQDVSPLRAARIADTRRMPPSRVRDDVRHVATNGRSR